MPELQTHAYFLVGFLVQSFQFLMLGDPETQRDLGERLGLGVIWTDVVHTYGQMVFAQ